MNLTNFLKDWGAFIAVLLAVISGVFWLGGLNERVNRIDKTIEENKKEVSSYVAKIKDETDKALEEIKKAASRESNPNVLLGGELSTGYDMGVDSSSGKKDWVKKTNDYILMDYPKGQNWGAVFFTVGKPTNPPRPYVDMSTYKKLEIELRGVANG